MKFGLTNESIYAKSFRVSLGATGTAWPFADRLKLLESINGTIFDVIDYGNRENRTTQFTLAQIARADYALLRDYLLENAGREVRVEFENAGERVFGETITGAPEGDVNPNPVAYCKMLSVDPQGEQDYSQAHGLYGLNIGLQYNGTAPGASPAAANASLLDFLVEVDTVRAAYRGMEPGDAVFGERWLDTDTLILYERTATDDDDGYLAFDEKWRKIYTIADDAILQDADKYGYRQGVFYWSAFGDLDFDDAIGAVFDATSSTPFTLPGGTGGSATLAVHEDRTFGTGTGITATSASSGHSVTGTVTDNSAGNVTFTVTAVSGSGAYSDWNIQGTQSGKYKSGVINKGGIQSNGQSLDPRDGPTTMRLEGFSITAGNEGKFWDWLRFNGIPLTGAIVTLSAYDGTHGYVLKLVAGVNQTSTFTYANYNLRVEPRDLTENAVYPTKNISPIPDPTSPFPDRYVEVNTAAVGQPVIRTYGVHQYAKLQDISCEERTLTALNAATGETDYILINVAYAGSFTQNGIQYPLVTIGKSLNSGETWYELADDDIAILKNGDCTLKVLENDVGVNPIPLKGSSFRILDIDDTDENFYTLTLDVPDSTDFGNFGRSQGLIIAIELHSFKWQIDDASCTQGFSSHIHVYQQSKSGGVEELP